MCGLTELKELLDNNLFIQLNQEKLNIILDYQKFNNQFHEVNILLAQHKYFLREWKMLMFSKTSIQSFVYDFISLCFQMTLLKRFTKKKKFKNACLKI